MIFERIMNLMYHKLIRGFQNPIYVHSWKLLINIMENQRYPW